MLKLFKNITGKSESAPDDKTLKKDINLATCALLIELANADGKFSQQEKNNIVSVFKTKYSIPDEDIDELIKSSEEALKNSIDIWQFTNRINQNYTLDEKLRVIETVWEVAYSDGKLDQHEDYLAHKIASLLRLNHRQLIDAKLKVLHSRDNSAS